MLQAAAQRGVRVNIIVYKEVTQALTLSSSHTKHALENLHPNIAVFRHPDHLPDRQGLASDITASFQRLTLDSAGLTTMSKDALKGLYGMNDDVILYWAHHEKLCLIDGQIAFMGGLDMCFGRWDTHQHAIADVHPKDINDTVFPGQDYNNSRVLDFHDVVHWEQNQLDRKSMSRMGWSDVSISMHGAVVEDLRRHFVERWNFIYDTKYNVRKDPRYARLALYGRPHSSTGQQHGGPQQAHAYPSENASPHHHHHHQAPAPQWQLQPGVPPTYPPPGQHPPQHQSPSLPQQPYQAGGAATYPPPPGQHSPASTYQPGYTPPSHPSPSPQTGVPPYQSHAPGQGPPQYTYNGNSFPPPPPGPPPSHSPASQPYQAYQPPQQSPTPYYSPPPTQPQGQSQAPYFPPPPGQETPHSSSRGMADQYYEGERGSTPRGLREDIGQYGDKLRGHLAGQIHQYQDRLNTYGRPTSQTRGNMSCQVVRSCAKWSNGSRLEHSIADAYAAVIKNSEHFVYIENQFFITATGDSQRPVRNKIGAAIVERILRAARTGQKYKMIVVIPSVPCFAGDLRDDQTLGTRAIMEFQYNSISRGGNSIMELIAKEGFNPMDYIRFYNLRSYDRINSAGLMAAAEHQSGVNYEDARRQYDMNTAGPGGYVPGAARTAFDPSAPFQQYQHAAHQVQTGKAGSGLWDSVSSCYMLGGQDIRNVPWDGHPDAEIDAFVSEELYVHSKVGSAIHSLTIGF